MDRSYLFLLSFDNWSLAGRVPSAWDIALPTMSIGEIAIIKAQPDYAYAYFFGSDISDLQILIIEQPLGKINESNFFLFYYADLESLVSLPSFLLNVQSPSTLSWSQSPLIRFVFPHFFSL